MNIKNLPFNPFVGIRPYSFEESDLFFGRDKEISGILDLLRIKKYVTIVGDSGIGKTSFIQAGVIPKLLSRKKSSNKNKWIIVSSEPGKDLFENICCSLVETFENNDIKKFVDLKNMVQRNGASAIIKYIGSKLRSDQENILIIIDNLEQIFYKPSEKTTSAQESSMNFNISLINELMEENHLNLNIINMIRSDFLEDFTTNPKFNTHISDNIFQLSSPSSDILTDIIQAPLRLYDIKTENKLIDKLIELLNYHTYPLSTLQHIMFKLVETIKESDHQEINTELYQSIGGNASSVNEYANKIFHKLSILDKQLTRILFERLFYIDETERLMTFPVSLNLMETELGPKHRQLAKLIDLFYSGGYALLLYKEDQFKNDILIQLAHECLITEWQICYEWFNTKLVEERITFKLIKATNKYLAGEGDILIGSQLQEAINWRDKLDSDTDKIKEYHPELNKILSYISSCEEISRQQDIDYQKDVSRRKKIFLAAMVFLIIILIAIFFYWKFQNSATKQKTVNKTGETAPPQNDANQYIFSRELNNDVIDSTQGNKAQNAVSDKNQIDLAIPVQKSKTHCNLVENNTTTPEVISPKDTFSSDPSLEKRNQSRKMMHKHISIWQTRLSDKMTG